MIRRAMPNTRHSHTGTIYPQNQFDPSFYTIFADPKQTSKIETKQTRKQITMHHHTLVLLGLIALLSLITPTLAGPDWWTMYQNELTCARKDVRALGAINAFCNTNVYTGGAYAAEGYALGGARVGISASCKWGTYVPQVWCQSQMYEVCAYGNGKGRGERKYDGGCQHFWITNG
jgi:hypothetical protein